jgi:2-succinyl-5-enolpyruvyl-6-hydroxy-3-cyclohexene-1-carboxylate synthase
MLIDAGPPRDPAHLATDHLRADPAATLSALAACVQSSKGAAPNNWLATWRAADTEAREAIHAALSEQAEPSEARVAAEVGAALPDGATLVAGNSMPVRDIDAFIRGDGRDVRIVGTRGANGIDGVVSTALGAAAVSSGPVVLLVGDLSFFHDMNGLLAARRFGLDATIVVVNNDGGGIFSFLPQAGQLDTACFEQLFGTPLGLDIESIARLYQASYARPADWQAFRHDLCQAIAAPGLSIVEVVTDRARNVAQHRAVWERVAAALRAGEGLPCP